MVGERTCAQVLFRVHFAAADFLMPHANSLAELAHLVEQQGEKAFEHPASQRLTLQRREDETHAKVHVLGNELEFRFSSQARKFLWTSASLQREEQDHDPIFGKYRASYRSSFEGATGRRHLTESEDVFYEVLRFFVNPMPAMGLARYLPTLAENRAEALPLSQQVLPLRGADDLRNPGPFTEEFCRVPGRGYTSVFRFEDPHRWSGAAGAEAIRNGKAKAIWHLKSRVEEDARATRSRELTISQVWVRLDSGKLALTEILVRSFTPASSVEGRFEFETPLDPEVWRDRYLRAQETLAIEAAEAKHQKQRRRERAMKAASVPFEERLGHEFGLAYDPRVVRIPGAAVTGNVREMVLPADPVPNFVVFGGRLYRVTKYDLGDFEAIEAGLLREGRKIEGNMAGFELSDPGHGPLRMYRIRYQLLLPPRANYGHGPQTDTAV